MTAVIIEDEYPAVERLLKLLAKADARIQVVATLESVAASRRWFASNPPPDLIFSDIQLSDGLSFEVFESVSIQSLVIFTTSYDEYAIKAFKLKSVDYLLKPVKLIELQAAIAKYWEMSQRTVASDFALRLESLLDQLPTQATGRRFKHRFLVKQQEQLVPVPVGEVAYFFTGNEMVCLVRQDGKQFLIGHTLEELEKVLDPARFFRINRQFLANLGAISKIHTHFNGKLMIDLRPAPTEEVLVSREKAQVFKEWLESGE
jgi:DNA-binding LytR/AlgR family response regulator